MLLIFNNLKMKRTSQSEILARGEDVGNLALLDAIAEGLLLETLELYEKNPDALVGRARFVFEKSLGKAERYPEDYPTIFAHRERMRALLGVEAES